jgi:hypothetical protein
VADHQDAWFAAELFVVLLSKAFSIYRLLDLALREYTIVMASRDPAFERDLRYIVWNNL